ncbi:STAS domain-containing protein [Cellulomonas sp. HZM]|uniref:STAS domain-containing protein n=1 Tax=Cellulomonas sp. HZM TaxID=1454010 RepID=UPI00068A3FEC|nr:STAS domain-containing protein [Cellulomonas sp. HZM]
MPIDVTETDDDLPMARPPAGYTLLDEWTLGSADELASLRSDLGRRLEAEGASPTESLDDTPSKIVLIASELATNALHHGLPPTLVRLHRRAGSYLLEVADHDVAVTPVFAGRRVLGAGGLGLHLARELSLDVGWFADASSKTVWAVFDEAPDAAMRQAGSVSVRDDGVVVLVGEIDAALSERLEDVAHGAEDGHLRPALTIDASDVTFVDSTVVRFIALTYRSSGERVRIVGAPERLRFLVEVMGVRDLVDLVDQP